MTFTLHKKFNRKIKFSTIHLKTKKIFPQNLTEILMVGGGVLCSLLIIKDGAFFSFKVSWTLQVHHSCGEKLIINP